MQMAVYAGFPAALNALGVVREVSLPRASRCRCRARGEVQVRRTGTFDRRIVRHHGKRLVEVVQQPLPLLVLRRSAKALFVGLQRVPFHQQQVFAGPLDAALQPVRAVSRHGRDDALRLAEGVFERGGLARAHLQGRGFEIMRRDAGRRSLAPAHHQQHPADHDGADAGPERDVHGFLFLGRDLQRPIFTTVVSLV